MAKIIEILNQSLETSRKMQKLLFSVAGIYIITLLLGYWMIHAQVPSVVKLVEGVSENVSSNPIFTPIIGALQGGNLAFAIIYTFLINLTSGAFISTTLPGVFPLLGGVWAIIVTGIRGFIIGAAYYYVFSVSAGYTLLALGTLILELGAYVFSAAAGINISLAIIFPNRYNVSSRLAAFREAWKDAGRIYIIVVILLALGAIWEMSGLFLYMD
ncbi:stage II sporulation protein M [[Eubacterium] cellulosolvens]